MSADPNGGVWVSDYDRAGRVTAEVAPDYIRPVDGTMIAGAATSYGYDRVGNVTGVEDPDGNQTGYTYDDFDRVVSRSDPKLGSEDTAGVWRYRYDDAGRLTQQRDPLGARVLATYDELGNRTSVSEVVRRDGAGPVTHTTGFRHDPAGNVTAVIDPTGARQVATYDPAGQLRSYLDATQSVSADPKAVTFSYDPAGRLVEQVDQLGRRSSQSFDLAGRQTGFAHFDSDEGRWLTTAYGGDPAGNLTSQTSPRGHVEGFSTVYGYDPAGRLTTVTEPVDATTDIVTGYGYDPAGNLTRFMDGNGNVTAYTHSSWGLPETVTEAATATASTPGERSYVTSYDSRGLPEVEQLPDQVTINREFDALANLISETANSGDPDIPGASREFRFNPVGDLVALSHPDGQIGYVYDDRGLLVEQTEPDGTTTGFGYDPNGRLAERSDPAGVTRFGYDPRGLVDTVTDPITGAKLAIGYDDAGQQVTETLPGYGARAVAYDDLGRPTRDTLVDATGTTTYAQSTDYDDNNNPTAHTYGGTAVPAAQTGTNTYSYDRADRLTGHTEPGGTLTAYGWDHSGNRTQTGDVTYSYNQRNQLTASSAGDTYGWSDRGTRDTHTVGAVTVTDTYDAFGELVDHNNRTSYRHDALGRITDRTVDSQPAEMLRYDHFNIDPVTVGDTRITRDPTGTPLTTVTGDGAPGWVTTNAHTDLAAATTTNGTTVSLYGPFGTPTTPTTGGPLGFQGDLTDPTSGNVWMGARHHDPTTGTFTTRDSYPGTTSQPNTLNRYAYGAANPLRYHDPDGHAVFDPWTGGFDPSRFVIDREEGGINLLACSEADIPDELRKYNPATFGENLTPACQDVQLKYSLVNNGKLSVGDACAAMPDADVPLCHAFFVQVSRASLHDAMKLSLKIIGYYSQFLQTIILIGLGAIAPAAGMILDTTLSCTQAIEANESNWADQAGCAAGVAAGFTTAIKGAKQTGLAFDDYLATQQTQRTSTSGTQNYTNWGDELTDGARMVDQAFTQRGLTSEHRRLALQNVTDSGDTVLGKYPGYITKANARGASYFDIGNEWDRLTSQGIEPWDLNVEFLRNIAARGDRVLLSVPKAEVPAKGYLRDEINYLTKELDYVWVNQWSLRPRG